jgi:hypothetical protein
MKNRLISLLKDLPSYIAEEKEAKLKLALGQRWHQTIKHEGNDLRRIKAPDLKILMDEMGVSMEFFIGDEEKYLEEKRSVLKKYYTLVAA